MKLWKLVFLIFLTNSVSAFFVDSGANHGMPLQIQQKQISISVKGETARVEIVTELYNPTETEIVFQVIEPLQQGMEIVDFFLDMEGKAYSLLEGKERLEYLFAQAKEREEAQLLSWGSDQYPKLFRSENIAIEAQQKVRTKNVFNVSVKVQDDFNFLELFLGSENPSFPTEIALTISQPTEYFLHPFGASALVDTTDGVSFLWTGNTSDMIQFFWSDIRDAEIGVPYLGMEYRARFVQPPKKDIQEVSILIDRSGSLTGLPWQRAKDWTEFLLETFGENVRVRIGFFSDEIAWHDEKFQNNTYEFKKDFFGFLSGIAPVGKTGIEKALLAVQQGWTVAPEKRVVFLITDKTTLGEDLLKNILKTCEQGSLFPCSTNETYVTLQFSENLENDLALFSKISGGFPIKLFRSSPNLVEKDEFLKKLSTLNTFFVQEKEWRMQDIVPKFFPSQMRTTPFFFVGRTDKSSEIKNVSAGHFVSRMWGAFKIAEILQTFLQSNPGVENASTFLKGGGEKINPGVEKMDALLAIGRTFGISTNFFDDKTTREELEENLDSASRMELLEEIYNFQFPISNFQFSNENKVKFLDGVPVYRIRENNPGVEKALDLHLKKGFQDFNPGVEDEKWQQFNFPELVRAETHIKIAPFSEAQRQLFVQFPEFVAEGFGIGREVDFCTEFRCISVLDGEREESKPADRAFFKDYNVNHWAHSYIVRAVNEGLIEPAQNGKLHPDRAIDRGEFAKLVVKLGYVSKDAPDTYPNFIQFSDVHDPEYFDAVQLLAQKGIVKGYPDGTFRPLQSLTRAEGVKILLAIADFRLPIFDLDSLPLEEEKSIFTDVTGWEKPWVAEAVRRGMVKGYGDGTFRPHGKLTRAEALKLVFEMKKLKN